MAMLLFTYFGLQVVSLFYSENLLAGVKNLETKFTLILFPIIFFSGHNFLESTEKRTIPLFFAHSACFVCLFVLERILTSVDSLQHAWSWYTFENLSEVIGLHPGYFSLYLCFSILVLLVYFPRGNSLLQFFVAGEMLFLVFFVFRLASRMPMVGLFVAIFIYLLLLKKYRLIGIGVVFSVGAFFILSINSPDIEERFLRPLRMVWAGDMTAFSGYLETRIQIHTCSFEILRGTNLLMGVGVGDADDALIRCYNAHDFSWIASLSLNAHNEYIQATLEAGIFGFLVLCSLMIAPSRFRTSETLFFLFAILFGIFSLTESSLQVQKGVVFFSFFYSLFASFAGKLNLRKNVTT